MPAARIVEVDMDDTWIQVERSPAPPTPPAPPERPAREVTHRRPRSLGDPDDRDDTAPTAALPDSEDQLTLRLNRPD